MEILVIIGSSFIAALVAPALCRIGTRTAGWLLTIVPAGAAYLLALYAKRVWAGETILFPLGLSLSFRLDGFSILFALLIAGIGAIILIYSSGYMAEKPHGGRSYALMFLFIGSMLGVALSENLLQLYVFWELTTVSCFLLIGFKRDHAASRKAAMQALVVNVCGGLALLAGILLLHSIAGSFEIAELVRNSANITAHELYPAVLALVVLAAFTKSAQFPFHFWVPKATEAPTPASAYLHSTAMLKAGVFLLARLTPVLGGTDAWFYTLTIGGGFTMGFAALSGLRKTDLKQILAYATIAVLGMLVLVIGLGTPVALKALMTYFLAHAFYKAALFMTAGNIGEKTGGLARRMPVTALAGLVSAVSMAGIPLTLGFIGQMEIYSAAEHAPVFVPVLVSAVVFACVLLFVLAAKAGFRPLFSRAQQSLDAREAPFARWIGPLVLAAAGVAAGCLPEFLEAPVHAAAGAISPHYVAAPDFKAIPVVTPTFLLSLGTYAAGISLYLLQRQARRSR